MVKQEENIENVPWNMAQIYYFELAKLLRYKDFAYLEGDINAYRKSLRAIWRRIYFKLNLKEIEEFISMFHNAENLLKVGGNNPVYKEKALSRLDDIDTLIIQKMNKYGMIFPDVEIKGLDTYEKKMKL